MIRCSMLISRQVHTSRFPDWLLNFVTSHHILRVTTNVFGDEHLCGTLGSRASQIILLKNNSGTKRPIEPCSSAPAICH
jgi:uncharacterized membrane protein